MVVVLLHLRRRQHEVKGGGARLCCRGERGATGGGIAGGGGHGSGGSVAGVGVGSGMRAEAATEVALLGKRRVARAEHALQNYKPCNKPCYKDLACNGNYEPVTSIVIELRAL